jgi:putative ABC transport system permease protein
MVTALRIRLGRSLLALRMQGLSIAMVVAAGVAAHVASMSTHESLKSARDEHYLSTRFPDLFVELTRAPAAVAEAIGRLPGVSGVRHGLAWHARLEIDGIEDPLSARLMSLPEPDAIGQLTVLEGRWPAPGSREALLGEAFAERRAIRPGQMIRVVVNGRTEKLVVAGLASSPEYILGAAHGGMSDDRSFGLIWMDQRRLARAIDREGSFNTMALTLETRADRDGLLIEIDRRLARYGGRGAYGREDQFSNRALSQEIAEQRVFATVLPMIFLAISVFVLHVVLSRRVSTERDQIATLRALGYGAIAIGSHYLLIAMTIAGVGAAIGLAVGARLGIWLTELYAGYFRFPDFSWRLPTDVALFPVVVALIGGAAAAVMPVRTVLDCSPAEAMQPPAPKAWRRGPWAGSGRTTHPVNLMILRAVLMRPIRSLFTLLGIAGSVAILISGSWWRDAIDHLLHIQFELAMPADVYLALQPAVSASARTELLRLPGVISAELHRAMPVRLHGPAGSERMRLETLSAADILRRPFGTDGQPGKTPDTGLLLSEKVARTLGVLTGDRVEIEFLEGRRLRPVIEVESLLPEPMGRSAYVAPERLLRLSGEALRHDQVALQVEADRHRDLDRSLRERPAVVATFRKDELLARIRESSRRNMLVFSAVLTVFAAAIAMGVIYNSARIALSERRWELATLRVLGMTEAEVSRLLLGELAAQTLIAMPLGCIGGWALAELLVSMMSGGQFTIPVIIWPRTYVWAVASALLTGLLSAWLVRRRLARLDLIAVLKVRE